MSPRRRNFPSGRLKREVLIFVFFLGVALVYSQFRPQSTPTFTTGPFRVVDGDTLTIDGMRLRLAGIDAPERRQLCGAAPSRWPCGLVAGKALAARLEGLRCELKGNDKYRRRLASCRMPNGDLGAHLVRNGLAVAYGAYRAEEEEARKAGRGLWSGPFERPQDWRKAHRPKAGSADGVDLLDILKGWWYGSDDEAGEADETL